jgi:hypothetical protein
MRVTSQEWVPRDSPAPALVWALVLVLVLALLLKLFDTREIGRYTVATGHRLLTWFAGLLGPRASAVWVILVPQLVVARDLTTLFSEVYGSVGFWFMVLALMSAFWTVTLTNQDGWQRLCTGGVRRIAGPERSDRRWARPVVVSRTAVVFWSTLLPFGSSSCSATPCSC